VVEQLSVLGLVERVWHPGLVTDCRENNVECEKEEDVERLAKGRHVAELEGKGASMVRSDGGGVNEVRFYLKRHRVSAEIGQLCCAILLPTLSERVSTKGSHRIAHVRTIGRPSAKTISVMLYIHHG